MPAEVHVSAKKAELRDIAHRLLSATVDDDAGVDVRFYAQDDDAEEVVIVFDNDDMEDAMRGPGNEFADGLVVVTYETD